MFISSQSIGTIIVITYRRSQKIEKYLLHFFSELKENSIAKMQFRRLKDLTTQGVYKPRGTNLVCESLFKMPKT